MASRIGSLPRKEKEIFDTPPEIRQPGQLALIRRVASKKIFGIIIVFFDACGDGKNIRVKNNVVGGKADFFSQYFIGPLADADTFFDRICLAVFIKSHDHGAAP